jgi:hypothetical protein
MLSGLERYGGPILFILSGRDLTAREFSDAVGASPDWRRLFADMRVCRRDLPDADHTFSRREWREQVALWTHDWLGERIAHKGTTAA